MFVGLTGHRITLHHNCLRLLLRGQVRVILSLWSRLFKAQELDYIHRLILHEKAHFLWEHLFDEQLKEDWIERLAVGLRTRMTLTAGLRQNKLNLYLLMRMPRIQMKIWQRASVFILCVRTNSDHVRLLNTNSLKIALCTARVIFHRYARILTFEVYNLYPDYVYPGKIIRVDIDVQGAPEEDKIVTVEIEIYKESEQDSTQAAPIGVFSPKGTSFYVWVYPVSFDGRSVKTSHILRGVTKVSKYAASGYWAPDTITLSDPHGNQRLESQTEFGWKLYIDNSLADTDPPQYVPNSMRLLLSKAKTKNGKPYQIVTANWQVIERTGLSFVRGFMNDTFSETYSRVGDGKYDKDTNTASINFAFPDYMPGGIYELNKITMKDIAGNKSDVYFTDDPNDEPPQTIQIQTSNPDFESPVLDINNITITAEPTKPDSPNGETIVDITFKVKDDISGYHISVLRLRDPQGLTHHFYHYRADFFEIYFTGDPHHLPRI